MFFETKSSLTISFYLFLFLLQPLDKIKLHLTTLPRNHLIDFIKGIEDINGRATLSLANFCTTSMNRAIRVLKRHQLHSVISSTFKIVQILVQSHFELVSSVLALEATELLSEPVTQIAFELINNHLISVQQKR